MLGRGVAPQRAQRVTEAVQSPISSVFLRALCGELIAARPDFYFPMQYRFFSPRMKIIPCETAGEA
jgi:hypothetical protein